MRATIKVAIPTIQEMNSMSEMPNMLKEISTLYRKTQMYLEENLKPLSLSKGQATFIMCICDHKVLTQNKLGEMLDMDKSTVAKTLARMEQQGYITRSTNSDDSRSLNVRPTEKAWSIYPKTRAIGDQWCEEITKDLTGIEKDIFYQLMQRTALNATRYFE